MSQNGPENPLTLPKDKRGGPGDIGNDTSGGVSGNHPDIPPLAKDRDPKRKPLSPPPAPPSQN